MGDRVGDLLGMPGPRVAGPLVLARVVLDLAPPPGGPIARAGGVQALRALSSVLRDRQTLPRDLERARRRVDRAA